MSSIEISQDIFSTPRHTSAYLACGPKSGPLMIFTHGWPERGLSWRHQLRFFGGMGFRAIAPDMRGYGESSVYDRHEDYSQRDVVQDMIELIDGLESEKAIWIGHDWGAPVGWNMASHHPDRCHGVAGLCVPYASIEQGIDHIASLSNRDIYPESEFPAAQWEYMKHYEENFEAATKPMDANPRTMIQAIFRKGSPDVLGQPSATAFVRKQGWFGGLPEMPPVPRDDDVITEDDLNVYVEGLERNGFFGPNSWYMNHERNAAYFKEAVDGGVLSMPALFLHGHYDSTCDTLNSRLADPMREMCRNLTEAVVESGHWMAQERPEDVNRELVKWIVSELPGLV